MKNSTKTNTEVKAPELIPIAEAAELLKCSIGTLYNKTSQRSINYYKVLGHILFDKNYLIETFLISGYVGSKDQIKQQAGY
ncbi:MAG: helix-turn-helix domain-containing protein [Ignavibacteriales bacterium]|nr:helix-turn-helix domain-containing protein [Ignavibacteriales bacterium]MCF8316578.1 helix-turn-helix domain-containing protein [Ignavibacteriales bacterium]MCF8437501.1 helix-turn-helix domain-containing protein [Ignavibacteriales bacterium]